MTVHLSLAVPFLFRVPVLITLCAFAPIAQAAAHPRAPLALPDTGTFVIYFNDVESGRERFAIERDSSGVFARARTQIALGTFTLDDSSFMHLDRAFRPLVYVADGHLSKERIHARVELHNGRASVTTTRDTTTQTQTIEYTRDAVFVPDNTLYAFLLLYMTAAERVSPSDSVTLPLYPKGRVHVRPAGSETHGELHARRYEVNLSSLLGLTLWVDERDRVVKIAVPLQNIEAVRAGASFDAARALGSRAGPTSPDAPLGCRAEEVTFPSGDIALSGTLLVPQRAKGRLPAVVLISGSGPQDRNEDTPGKGGVHFGIFRDVAFAIAERGVAVLRYDDRGVGASGGNYQSASLSDYAADVRAAIAFLRNNPAIDPRRIGLVGHSEGAILALGLAAGDSKPHAIALLAGTAQPFAEIVMAQALDQARKGGLTEQQVAQIAARESAFVEILRAHKKWTPETVPPDFMSLLPRKAWLEDMVALDMPPLVKRVRCPVGIFQGGKDDQVAPRSAAVLDSLLTVGGNRHHRVFLFPSLNHLFIESSGGGYAEYTDTSRHVDRYFLSTLARWVDAHMR
jgi:pimeloyl-ACP methyl ester carboxylesterase